MTQWIYACEDAALSEGKGLAVELPGPAGTPLALALFRSEGTVYALDDRCPHRGARLSGGPVYEPCKVACLDHGWSIDLRTGSVDAPEHGQVRTYPVKREGSALFVNVAEAT
ncbi:MAG: Rieske (2Fe-2S) protein [Burkholderiales bacterium]|nr:Rieske (2Fe-2S) protein [Burkholderiales bacterium]